jgi:glycosyltransferase involved in cell wall biosynthesis
MRRVEMPRFSIIMPTFRRQHVINRTIDTILAQTFPDWELIIVDNEGAGYRFEDARIRSFVHLERGASQARNFGIGRAVGELLSFFDDDDLMYPAYLATFHRVFQQPEVMMAHCGMLTGSDGSVVNFSYATPEVVVRRRFAGPQWESGDCHDQKYFHRLISAHQWGPGQIVEIPEVLVKATTDGRGGLRDPEGLL